MESVPPFTVPFTRNKSTLPPPTPTSHPVQSIRLYAVSQIAACPSAAALSGLEGFKTQLEAYRLTKDIDLQQIELVEKHHTRELELYKKYDTFLRDGTREIISEGTGGKVDVLVLGKNPQENTESFIYKDKSNTTNASSALNDVILGQIPEINGTTINRKRFQSNQLGLFPLQPVNDVIEFFLLIPKFLT